MNHVKHFLPVILITMFSLNLTAQEFDPFDYSFKASEHILRPAEVIENHVATCTIRQEGKEDKVITYDGNGRVVDDGTYKYFYIYDAYGNILTAHVYNFSDYIGQYEYKYDGDAQLTSIKRIIETDYSKSNHIVELSWEEGKIMKARDFEMNIVFGDYYGFDHTYDYLYYETGELWTIQRSGKDFFKREGDEEEGFLPKEATLTYENGVNMGSIEMIWIHLGIADDEGRLLRMNQHGTMADPINGPEGLTLVREYSYYPNGLVKSKTTPRETLNYEYEYLAPATFNLNVPENLTVFRIWNYSQNYGFREYEISGGQASVEFYVPATELYVMQLTEELLVPFIAEPGQVLNCTVTPDKVSFGETDMNNLFLTEIEGSKRYMNATDPDNAIGALAGMFIESMPKYPDYMGFLFYTDYWDFGKGGDLFLDYTERMKELYPLNFKAHEWYELLNR